ncbi:hypothetical protein VTJ04DRAFT_10194 [Mycothermus thermophilus]|uniref:uncharacterized protein n=1 Tax=Humicola insolens TaxID=85995 RepID=UPI00374347D6
MATEREESLYGASHFDVKPEPPANLNAQQRRKFDDIVAQRPQLVAGYTLMFPWMANMPPLRYRNTAEERKAVKISSEAARIFLSFA